MENISEKDKNLIAQILNEISEQQIKGFYFDTIVVNSNAFEKPPSKILEFKVILSPYVDIGNVILSNQESLKFNRF